MKFGNDVEEPLRALFRVMHPEYQLEFVPYTVLRRDDEFDFMFSTPDGWLTEIDTGRKGLYESKSSSCYSAKEFSEWQNKVPDGYYCQLLHSMYVGGFDFAVLFAILLNSEGDASVRAYKFERQTMEGDMQYLVGMEREFWKHVTDGTMPPLKISF